MKCLSYTGWAVTAYPDQNIEYFRKHVKRQVELGSNFLWIGQNNPGEVIENKEEPALSYAVYEVYINKNHPKYKIAEGIINSQKAILKACAEFNLPAVFPIGYQIQMGEDWNNRNKNELRRDKDNNIIDWGGKSASFYSEQYRKDIIEYYHWIHKEWIIPYRKVIMMVNLADEPFGCDY